MSAVKWARTDGVDGLKKEKKTKEKGWVTVNTIKQGEGTRLKLEEADLLHTFLPLQSFLAEPVSFPEAPQVDGLSAGRVFPRHINLPGAPNVGRGHLTISLTGANKDSFGSSCKITKF